MKIIDLKGGLGNQMFQYAYGRKLELTGKKVAFNVSFFNGHRPSRDTARDFKLNNFKIETKAEFLNKTNYFINLLNKVLIRFYLKKNDYWQGEKYFKNIEANIRKEFTLKNLLTSESTKWQEKIRQTKNSVSLHIRRGDYVQDAKTNAFHGTCNLEYYKNALQKIVDKIGNTEIEIFIFSDDIEWAKENLKFPYPTNFVSNSQILDYEEMYLMSLCQHNIIANSTFSWWGAWLNKNSAKIVIAPKQWSVKKSSDGLNILPKEWLQI